MRHKVSDTVEQLVEEFKNLRVTCDIPRIWHDGRVGKDIDVLIDQALTQAYEQGKADAAKQARLECMAVEMGEGECSRAIKTKFNLEDNNSK